MGPITILFYDFPRTDCMLGIFTNAFQTGKCIVRVVMSYPELLPITVSSIRKDRLMQSLILLMHLI